MDPINELRILMINSPEKIVIGSKKTIKYLKLAKIGKVFLSKNVPEDIKSDIEYYSKLSNVEVIQLDLSNEELGSILKKPFKVAVVSVLK